MSLQDFYDLEFSMLKIFTDDLESIYKQRKENHRKQTETANRQKQQMKKYRK
jgi:hypothetical protein